MYDMDKETQDAFKTLGGLVTEGFKDVATKQDIKLIRQDMAKMNNRLDKIEDDTTIIEKDIKQLDDKVRNIVKEEVQDIRKDIEARCNPAQIGEQPRTTS